MGALLTAAGLSKSYRGELVLHPADLCLREGVGVGLSALSVLVYQGSITLLAQALSPLLSDSVIVAEMTCTGSLLIVAIALNMLKSTEIKVMNLLPAIVFPVLFCQFL